MIGSLSIPTAIVLTAADWKGNLARKIRKITTSKQCVGVPNRQNCMNKDNSAHPMQLLSSQSVMMLCTFRSLLNLQTQCAKVPTMQSGAPWPWCTGWFNLCGACKAFPMIVVLFLVMSPRISSSTLSNVGCPELVTPCCMCSLRISLYRALSAGRAD